MGMRRELRGVRQAQNSVCFLFAPMLFCPQSFQQAVNSPVFGTCLGPEHREKLRSKVDGLERLFTNGSRQGMNK